MVQLGQNGDASIVDLGRLAVLVQVNVIFLHALQHQFLGFWLHECRDKGRQLQRQVLSIISENMTYVHLRVSVQGQFVHDQLGRNGMLANLSPRAGCGDCHGSSQGEHTPGIQMHPYRKWHSHAPWLLTVVESKLATGRCYVVYPG